MVENPNKPWIVVFQALQGTTPPGSAVADVRELFTPGAFGGTSLADYWADQTNGVIDISKSEIMPEWKPAKYDIFSHPGVNTVVSTADLAADAKRYVADMSPYRGILAVYNYPCNAKQSGNDVVWGINGYGSTPNWAGDALRQCIKCSAMTKLGSDNLACPAGGLHATGERHYLDITDQDVPHCRDVSLCSRCGLLYDDKQLPTAADECAAGGTHQPGPAERVLSGWRDPPADRTWSICRNCRAITPDNAPLRCPAAKDGKHTAEAPASAHFPYTDIDYEDLSPRGFLSHEMGHAYGFAHGRGIDPRSTHITDDCWPSAYRDAGDIMSYADCDSYEPFPGDVLLHLPPDPDHGLGVAGPALSITHLLTGQILTEDDLYAVKVSPTRPFDRVLLRPPTSAPTSAASFPGARFGDFVVEYRRKGPSSLSGPRPSGWDRNLTTGSNGIEPGCLRIHWMPAGAEESEKFNLVPAAQGGPFLSVGGFCQGRSGISDFVVTLDSLTPDGSDAVVTFSQLPMQQPRDWQRFLLIPYRLTGSTATFDRPKANEVLAAAEQFWRDMAGEYHWLRDSRILASGTDDAGGDPFTANLTAAEAGDPAARTVAAVTAALAATNPANNKQVLPMDWRWFSGIVLLSLDGCEAGYLGPHDLPSGVFPSEHPDPAYDHGDPLPDLPYELIELSAADLSQATLARSLGQAMGFPLSDTPYSLMNSDNTALRFTPASGAAFGMPTWGPTGPSLTAEELEAHGWLGTDAKYQVTVDESGYAQGSIELIPMYDGVSGRSGLVLATIGPYNFQLRGTHGWDSGISDPLVLANGIPQRLHDSVTWGNPAIP